MADIQWSDVEALQANLADVSETAQDMILAHVNNDLNPGAFGGEDAPRYTLARCYLAAHLGELCRRNGNMTPSSKTIGTSAITIAYAQAAEGEGAALSATSWGGQFHALVRSSTLRIGGGRTS